MIKRLAPVAGLLALLPSVRADSAALTRLLPADTDLVVVVDDVPRLRTGFAESPAMRAWQDPEIQAWLAPLRERFDWEKINADARAESGVSPQEVIDWMQGGAVLAVRDFRRLDGEAGAPPPFVLAVEFGENADRVAEFLTDRARRRMEEAPGYRRESEDYGGVEVHALYPPDQDEGADDEPTPDNQPMVWAMHEGTLFASPVKEEVLALLDAQQDGGVAEPLAGSARLERLRAANRGADLLVSLRLPSLIAMIEGGLQAKAQTAEPNPMMPPPRQVIEGLGLDAWEDAWLAWRLDGDGSVGEYGLAFRELRGLLTLLQHEARSFPQPDWIPAAWKNVAVYRFELHQFLPRVQQIVSTISPPMGGMMQGMLAQMTEKTGVDLQRDLLGRMGDELVAVQRFEAVQPGQNPLAALNEVPQMLAVSLGDAAGFEQALNTLLQSGGPGLAQLLKTRDYLGHRISSFEPPVPPGAPPGSAQSLHYAIAGGTFFIGVRSVAPVEEALQAIANGGGEFWEREDVRAALQWAPADASGFQVQDVVSIIGVVVPAMETALGMGAQARMQQARDAAIAAGEDPEAAAAAVRDEMRLTDPTRTPSPEVFAKYFGANWSTVMLDETSLRATVRMLPPGQ